MDSGNSKPARSWLLTAILTVAIVGLLFAIAIPNFVGGGGPGRFGRILNNLRRIDGAKNQWALEHGATNSGQSYPTISEQNLAPYLHPSFFQMLHTNSTDAVQYSINDINKSPEALLTQKLKEKRGSSFSLPKGTVIRLNEGDFEYVLPDQESKIYRYNRGVLTVTNR